MLVAVEDEERMHEETARRLIASWLADGTAADAGQDTVQGGGLSAAPADAGTVIGLARRMATDGLAEAPPPRPPVELALIAEALVVDEHPSAGTWTPEERADLVHWVAVLMQRFGEDGVQRLMEAMQ